MIASAGLDVQAIGKLRATFGFDSFRPLQGEIVSSILNRRDVFVLMPTGGGKSLCYQLPALLLDGTAIVVSPLIALMKDQVDALRALGVAATYINSSLDRAETARRQAALARGQVKLVYVAPERLMMPGFLQLLSKVRIAFFAIDEAHCISEWGHDFRPEYRQLTRLRALFPDCTLAAFTATATRRVQADVVGQLGLQSAACFRGSFNRPNLYYQVRPKKAAYQQLTQYMREREPVSGIVYCQRRADTESLAAMLRSDGFSATAYHAGLESDERRLTQEAFVRDDIRVIVATIAFGMGIDKPDVRFVVHYDLPKNLEGYYQESGRAGRDGDPSDCILYYSYADAIKHEYFIKQKPSKVEQAVARQQLRKMVDWAQSTACRRHALLAYFDERLESQASDCCDMCPRLTSGASPRSSQVSPLPGSGERANTEATGPTQDYTVAAQMLLSCAKRTGERFGIAHLVKVLRGSRSGSVLRFGHDRLPTHGVGRDRLAGEWQDLAEELLREGYIRRQPDEANAVKVTERGHAVLFRREKVQLHTRQKPFSAVTTPASNPDPRLFERLRKLRKQLADEQGLPPYAVFHDSTLRQMANQLPITPEELRLIHGVGEEKGATYGPAFLAAIADYVRQEGRPPSAPVPPRRSSPGPSVSVTVDLFKQGRSVVEIATVRGLAQSTIEGHLAEAMEAGERLEIERLVSEEKQRRIEGVLMELGPGPLKAAMERLGDGYSYAELRFIRAGQILQQRS